MVTLRCAYRGVDDVFMYDENLVLAPYESLLFTEDLSALTVNQEMLNN